MPSIPPPPDRPSIVAVHPRYARLRARVANDDDRAILDEQYANMSDDDRLLVEELLATADMYPTPLHAACSLRFVMRLLHLTGLRPEQRRTTLRAV